MSASDTKNNENAKSYRNLEHFGSSLLGYHSHVRVQHDKETSQITVGVMPPPGQVLVFLRSTLKGFFERIQ